MKTKQKNWIKKHTTKYPMDWIFSLYTYYYKFHWLSDCDCYVRNEHWNEWCRNSKGDRLTMTKMLIVFLSKSFRIVEMCDARMSDMKKIHTVLCVPFFAVVERFEAVVRLFYIFVTVQLLLFYSNFIAPNVCDWIMNKIYISFISSVFKIRFYLFPYTFVLLSQSNWRHCPKNDFQTAI